MAIKIEGDLHAGRGRRSVYPWDEWLDGSHWLLARGEDFKTEPHSFRSAIYAACTRRGVKATVSVKGDEVHVQAVTSP